MITFNLQEVTSNQQKIENLSCEINSTIKCFANKRLTQIDYGLDSITDEEYYDYLLLVMLKKILINKTCNSDCLYSYSLKQIMSLTQDLLYKFCC